MAGRPWTEAELAEVRTRYVAEEGATIARDLGRTVAAVRRKANILGVSRYTERIVTHYTVDADTFNELTAETAYVLGVVIADGNIRGDRLKITNNNLDLMQRCRLALKSNHRLVVPGDIRDRTFSILIHSPKLIADLHKWGVTENKSLTATWPTVPIGLFPHLLRGYFDGDGYAAYSRRGGLRVKFTSGSPSLLTGLAEQLEAQLGVPARPFQSDRGRLNAHRLWYYGHNAYAIGEAMYAVTGAYTQRKREPFLAYANRKVRTPSR